MIPWINLEEFAGQTVTLSLRLSNPNENTEGKIKIDDLITHTMPLNDINKAFDLMHRGESIRSVVLY